MAIKKAVMCQRCGEEIEELVAVLKVSRVNLTPAEIFGEPHKQEYSDHCEYSFCNICVGLVIDEFGGVE